MSDSSRIEWTDTTWNPMLGCTRVSPGCNGCYAIPGAHMRASNPNPKIAKAYAGLTERTEERVDWTGRVNLLEERLTQPLRWRKPRRVFVNSMSDLFHEAVPDEYIAEVFSTMARSPRHTYQVLTKRHGRMRSLLNRPSFRDNLAHVAEWPLPNVWLGVSVEDQKHANLRVPALLETPAAVRWLSCEPLVGPVDLSRLLPHVCSPVGPCPRQIDGVDWVVAGGESGRDARPMHPAWVRSLRDQCEAGGVPFFFKQWGEWGPAPFVVRVCDPKVGWQGTEEELEAAKRDAEAHGATHVHTGNPYRTDDGQTAYYIHEMDHKPWSLERAELPNDHLAPIRRWGKKAAGRELDGQTWDQYPAVTP